MKRWKLHLMGCALMVGGLLAPEGAHAIPAFSRTYGLECGACHNGQKEFGAKDQANCVKCHKKKEWGILREIPADPLVQAVRCYQ